MNLLLDSLLDDVEKLIKLGVGDLSRLNHILQTIEQHKTLYESDYTYLKNLRREHLVSISDDSASLPSSVDSENLMSVDDLEKKTTKLQVYLQSSTFEKDPSNFGSWARSFGRGIAGVMLFLFGMAMVLSLYHILTHLDEFGRSIYYGGDPMASIIYIFVILPLIFLLIGGSSIYYGIRIISKT